MKYWDVWWQLLGARERRQVAAVVLEITSAAAVVVLLVRRCLALAHLATLATNHGRRSYCRTCVSEEWYVTRVWIWSGPCLRRNEAPSSGSTPPSVAPPPARPSLKDTRGCHTGDRVGGRLPSMTRRPGGVRREPGPGLGTRNPGWPAERGRHRLRRTGVESSGRSAAPLHALGA